MPDPFSRTRLLLGERALQRLAAATVAVFGVGGVGSAAAEALARCGVGAVTLVDADDVDVTNINRQIHATWATIGQPKTDAMRARLLAINPQMTVTARRCFFGPDTADAFDFAAYSYVIDAVDTVTAKLLLVERAQKAGVPVISCMGAGNKLDPARFRVADIYQTSVCPLARVMRRELRRRGVRGLKVVYSTEPPMMPQAETGPGGADQIHAARRQVPGSVSFVPPVAGMILAGEVVLDLIKKPGAVYEPE